MFLFTVILFSSVNATAQCGKVIKVTDGDTFTMVSENKSIVKVRLAFVDSPERNQDFGTKAKNYTSGLILNSNVCLEVKYLDPYKRAVAIVKLKNSKVLNEEIIKAGYAWHFTKFSHDPIYHLLEKKARDSGKGLWSKNDPVSPWEWRKHQGRKKIPGKHVTFSN